MSVNYNAALMQHAKANMVNTCSPKCCATQGLSQIAGLALFIIACMGAAGTFPGASIGWVTVGLGTGSFALNLLGGNCGKRKFEVILAGLIAAACITVGALGGTGILSTAQVGWGIIGTHLASAPFNCVQYCLQWKKALVEQQKQFEVI